MATITKSHLTISRYGGYIGAVISGVDLSRPQDEATYAALRRAFDTHGVIFFHDQQLTMEQYVQFGRHLGELAFGNGAPATAPDLAELQLMVKEPASTMGNGDTWHVDQSWRKQPTRGTVLRAVELPPFGGDTLFLSAAAAFDALPDAMKEALRTLRALHTRPWISRGDKFRERREQAMGGGWKNRDGSNKLEDFTVHPVVTRHPATDREILFINPGYTSRFEGWTEEQSAPLLKQLFDHCLQPEFQCRFKWSVNDIAYWDNRQVWHYASNDYHGHRREMHRLMVQ